MARKKWLPYFSGSNFYQAVSYVAAICLLSGCTSLCNFVCNNCEGKPTASSLFSDSVKQLAGRSYYRLGDDVSCNANVPGRPLLKTWANKITSDDKGLLIWGSICNDAPEFVPMQDVIGQIYIAPNLSSIIFKGETLTFYPEQPRLCEQGVWCPK